MFGGNKVHLNDSHTLLPQSIIHTHSPNPQTTP
jgi:protein lifeguard